MDFWNSAWQGPHFYSRRFQSICGERGGGWMGAGGGVGKHGIAKIGLTPPHPGTHIYSTLCIQEYLIGSQNNWDISCHFPCMMWEKLSLKNLGNVQKNLFLLGKA